METYAENPSIAQAMINTKKGFKPIFSKDSQTNISIYEENEEDLKSITLDFTRRCQAPSATAESLKGVAGLGELFQHGLVDGDRRVEAV
ncbi:hypothetical protein, partial [Ralstonia mannitolilytica]|uniref:hypothetical protein n=1 Tax=Ralstonia mannitolilytica TaxID=105219 RepID=UPI0029316102